MIGPLFEGIAQSILPCSWVVLLPALLVGVGTRRVRVLAVFALALVASSWIAIAGWFAPPVWFAGLALLLGAVVWYRVGPSWIAATAVGVGAGLAWQPCVGEELAQVLNTAQSSPLAALPGLTAFMFGILLVGLGVGVIVGLAIQRFTDHQLDRPTAVIIGLLGVSMMVGVYSSIASVLARWSTALWA